MQLYQTVNINIKAVFCICSDRPSVEECLNHPWLNTEELFQRSPIRKSRRSCSSEQKQRRKKLKKMQQQNGVADGEWFKFCQCVVQLCFGLIVFLDCLINIMAAKGEFIKIASGCILPVSSTHCIVPSCMQGSLHLVEESSYIMHYFHFLFFAVNASAVQTVGFEQEIAQSISNLLPHVTRFCLLCVPGGVDISLIFFRKPNSHCEWCWWRFQMSRQSTTPCLHFEMIVRLD